MKRSKLRKAQALIGTSDKWCKGEYYTFSGRRCAEGAMYDAGARESRLTEARELLTEYASVPEFNDAPETTHDDVMCLFDWAIAFDEVGMP